MFSAMSMIFTLDGSMHTTMDLPTGLITMDSGGDPLDEAAPFTTEGTSQNLGSSSLDSRSGADGQALCPPTSSHLAASSQGVAAGIPKVKDTSPVDMPKPPLMAQLHNPLEPTQSQVDTMAAQTQVLPKGDDAAKPSNAAKLSNTSSPVHHTSTMEDQTTSDQPQPSTPSGTAGPTITDLDDSAMLALSNALGGQVTR